MRLKKLWISIILICCSLLLLTACKEEKTVKSIVLNEYSAETPLELKMGTFSYGNYTVTVTYDNDETEVIPLTEEMIPETDQLKFYQEGTSEISIVYQGVQTSFAINVSRNVFSDNIQLKGIDEPIPYSGETVVVEVTGDIPGGTKITYPDGNAFKDVGSHPITAILQCDGYVTKTLFGNLEITLAAYEGFNPTFFEEGVEKKTVVYNKEKHTLTLQERIGDTDSYQPAVLPDGVSVHYTIKKVVNGNEETVNKAIDVGTYYVYATFTGDPNYQEIETVRGVLEIIPVEYDMSRVAFEDKKVTYSGSAHTLEIPSDCVPEEVRVDYKIKWLTDGRGDAKDGEYQDASKHPAIEAGEYLVKASFTLDDPNNYTLSVSSLEASLLIEAADYEDLRGLYLQLEESNDEGGSYVLRLKGNLPEWITPIFVVAENDSQNGNQNIIEGVFSLGMDTETGKKEYKYVFTAPASEKYLCKVTFTHQNANYNPISVELQLPIDMDGNN